MDAVRAFVADYVIRLCNKVSFICLQKGQIKSTFSVVFVNRPFDACAVELSGLNGRAVCVSEGFETTLADVAENSSIVPERVQEVQVLRVQVGSEV